MTGKSNQTTIFTIVSALRTQFGMCRKKNNSASSETDEDKRDNMMMANIVDFGKFSYELEEKREQSLINQSSQMMTAFSIFSAALCMVLPYLFKKNNELAIALPLCTSIVFALLITSLIFALLAQWRYKYKAMDDIDAFYRQIYCDLSNLYQKQAEFDMQWKHQIAIIHKSKKENNDKRSRDVVVSMWFFLGSVAAIVLSAFALILLSLCK
jgi:anaerobic C4-dicarboxylate transporter